MAINFRFETSPFFQHWDIDSGSAFQNRTDDRIKDHLWFSKVGTRDFNSYFYQSI